MTELDLRRKLRAYCLSFPEAVELETWGDPTYRVRNKIFAMEKGAGTEVWCKAPPGEQSALVGQDPDVYFVPPYVGHRGWVGVRLATARWPELKELVEESYRLTAPKRLVAVLDSGPPVTL